MRGYTIYLFALLILTACASASTCPAVKRWDIPEQKEIVKERSIILHEHLFRCDEHGNACEPVDLSTMPGVLDDWERMRRALRGQ